MALHAVATALAAMWSMAATSPPPPAAAVATAGPGMRKQTSDAPTTS
eukprot:SAG22_NODE_863_length_6804_cov_3.086652_5_plen_47_part_00